MNELALPYVTARSLKEVAHRAGRSQNWLSARLHGKSAITADDVYLLARGLRCDPCDFFAPEVVPAPIPSREDRDRSPLTMQENISARALDKLNPEHLDLFLAFLDFLEERSRG